MKMNLKLRTITVLFVSMMILGTATLINAQDWPMNGQNPGNTRYSPSYGPSTGDLQWVYTTGETVRSSPAMVDGKVYITSYSGNVYCIGSTLEERIDSLEAENEALKTENAALRSDLDALNAHVRETSLKLTELPGEKIDVYNEGEHIISPEDTTYIWHYHISDTWSGYTEEEKAEFLSTAQVHLYVNGEEISLTHVLRYREDKERMWSIYYRVFPPGYWEINRNNKLVGEWIHMDKAGDWVIETHTATLRVK